MTTYYSKSEKGFFDTDVHTPEQIPNDAVVITREYYLQLLENQSTGLDITADPTGYPINTKPVFTNEQLASEIRRQRDLLITNTDWTQSADIPQPTKDRWAPYRQALRDIPQQSGFPTNVTWPTPPN